MAAVCTAPMLACGGSPDSERRDASLAPYYQPCTRQPDSCPEPYECATTTEAEVREDVCLLPCEGMDCPAGFFCVGVDEESADIGADGHCAENV